MLVITSDYSHFENNQSYLKSLEYYLHQNRDSYLN